MPNLDEDVEQATSSKARSKGEAGYTEDSIQVREGIEHVRTRPAMYIGDIYERGLHHLVNEVVDNSVDEALAGFCTEIDVTIQSDGSITILDNGRGIPVGMHAKAKKPTVEVCLTVLGAGGKFDKGSYQVSGGLHGVGVSCVNALSEWLEAEVYRDGQAHSIRFSRGVTTKPLENLGPSPRRGTKITFKPDIEVFKQGIEFKFERVSKRLRELAYLNAGLKITLRDERGETKTEVYHSPKGLVDFVNALSTSENVLLSKPIHLVGKADSTESGGKVEVEIAIQYNDTYSDTIVSYANNINTIEGGTHETGFRTALTATLNNWLKENEKGKDKDEERPTGDDYREGLVAAISVKIPEPQFEGQTKTKLGNSDVAGIVQNVVNNYLKNWTEQNPAETKKIVTKALEAKRARLAAKKAKELVRKTKDALRGGGIAKLKDAHSNKPEECEIYLVEGDSAGGTAGEARDNETQAVLPLRGKILNVWKATHDKMLSHSEIATMITALGTGILDEFDISKLNYHKVVIMCDADVDGSHIRTLILTFFFRQMPELIRQGKVYIAQPPLYKITYKGTRAPKKDGGDGADATTVAADEAAEAADEAAVEEAEAAAEAKKGKKSTRRRELYISNDAEFERIMLEQGLEGARLELRGLDGKATKTIKTADVKKLVELMADLVRGSEELRKHGIELPKYLGRRRQDGKLPLAKFVFTGTKQAPAVYTEEELDKHIQAARADNKRIWLHTDPLSDRQGADVEITRFTSKERLEKTLDELDRMGLKLEHLFPRPRSDEDGVEPRFALLRDKDKEPFRFDGLKELPESVKKLGGRGVQIQRYKGLGEMDKDELEETTMDPKRRTLLRVTMEDMAEASRIFNILMGTKVEPRRDYIEAHAAEAKNLDV
jgi:DNA gyrase subunit B